MALPENWCKGVLGGGLPAPPPQLSRGCRLRQVRTAPVWVGGWRPGGCVGVVLHVHLAAAHCLQTRAPVSLLPTGRAGIWTSHGVLGGRGWGQP